MNRRYGKRGIWRLFCLCLAMAMTLSMVSADVYASALSESVSDEETAGGVTEAAETGETPETEEDPEYGEPEDEDLPEEASDAEDEQDGRSQDAEAVPQTASEKIDIHELIQTQEGLERALTEGLVTPRENNPDIATASTKRGTRAELVQIAKSQVGTRGRPNKYTYWYGSIDGYAYAWCQVFASWCGYQAGVSVPRTAACYYGYEWFSARGLWRSRASGYIPQPGDYIYFSWRGNGSWDHVGIVNYVKNGRVYTIEGNTGDMVKASKSYSLNDYEIVGYGTPRFADGGVENSEPRGSFESMTPKKGTYKVRLRGWAFDWDNPFKTVQVQIYVGGKAGSGAPVYTVKANSSRPDLDVTYPGIGTNHGFDVNIYMPVDRTKKQTVYVYAVDSSGEKSLLLGSKVLKKDKTIKKKEENKPDKNKPDKDKPDEDKPGDQPGTDDPGTDEPGTEDPGTDEPGTEDPGTDEPGTEDPGTDEPGTEDPGTDEPGTEDPGTDEPETEDPGTDEPVKIPRWTPRKTSVKQTAYNKLKFSWKKISGVDNYEVQYSTKKNFKKMKAVLVKKSSKSVSATVDCGTRYYFRVRSIRTKNGAKRYGEYSEAVSGSTTLGKAKIKTCTSSKKKRITIRTNAVEGAASYQVVYSLKSDFSGSKHIGLKSREGTITVNQSRATYYVKVRARRKVNGETVYGPFSAVKTVEVK